jgi:hypothetical protein
MLPIRFVLFALLAGCATPPPERCVSSDPGYAARNGLELVRQASAVQLSRFCSTDCEISIIGRAFVKAVNVIS